MYDRQRLGESVEVIAEVVKVQEKKRNGTSTGRYINKVKIMKARTGDTPLRMLQATEKEKSAVEEFLKKITGDKGSLKWGPFDALRKRLSKSSELLESKGTRSYSDALDTIIVQSLSGGKVGNANGRIHVGIIGPPSAGKKLLFRVARLLNAVTTEAQSGSVSQPGLAGSCVNQNGAWRVIKGLIPMAHKGVFGMQDFDKSQLKPLLLEILGPVMEDGVCIISKAARATFMAETGIYLDLNKASDLLLDSTKASNIIEDTGLPTYIVSRLDFITDFPKDSKAQFENACDSILSSDRPNRDDEIFRFCKKRGLDADRFLKLMTAYLMENYANIDVDPVRDLINKKYRKLVDANRASLHLLNNAAMFQMRFKNAIFKFVIALTRVQLLEVSNKEAVEKAFHLLSRKLEFLKALEPQLLVPRYRTGQKARFGAWLASMYGRRKFTIEEAFAEYEKAGSPLVKSREREAVPRSGTADWRQGRGDGYVNPEFLED